MAGQQGVAKKRGRQLKRQIDRLHGGREVIATRTQFSDESLAADEQLFLFSFKRA